MTAVGLQSAASISVVTFTGEWKFHAITVAVVDLAANGRHYLFLFSNSSINRIRRE